MRIVAASILAAGLATGCGWPFGTDTTCGDLANCGNGNGGGAGSDAGGNGGLGATSTGGRSGGGSGGAGGVSGSGGSGGAGGTFDGGDADSSPPCDADASPSVAACAVDDRFGFFVSPTGSDSNDGSRRFPFATLSQALASVTAAKSRIYACADAGSFAETIQNVGSLDGISFFGGFRCADFTYDPSLKTPLTSPDPTAWTVNGLTKGLTVEDFLITAADATAAGSSSIAVVVNQSANVVFRRVTIKSGKGADGTPGVTGAKGADGDVFGTDQAGKAADCTSAPAGQLGGLWNGPSTCGSLGGGGGAATKSDGAPGTAGSPNTSVSPPGVDNKGAGATTAGMNGSPGTDGSNGNDGPITTAAPALGTFTASGYATADGSDGTDGFPGQGGGGGGASKGDTNCVGASGGAGGMGGCGGLHGSGGKGGGASVALAVWQSSVTLKNVSLISANGGDAGKGGNGGVGGVHGDGAPGGGPDIGFGIRGGGRGGNGGDGGRGGAGSGGTGGPSYALLFKGTPPTGAATKAQGLGGAKGLGGFVEGTTGTNKAPDGSDGDSKPEHEVQ